MHLCNLAPIYIIRCSVLLGQKLEELLEIPAQLRHLSLFLVVCVDGIVDGVVETTALFALYRHAGDEITHVDHVAKLA